MQADMVFRLAIQHLEYSSRTLNRASINYPGLAGVNLVQKRLLLRCNTRQARHFRVTSIIEFMGQRVCQAARI